MNLLRKLFGGANSAGSKDYDYYVIQKRQGGIYGRWETIEDNLPDFMDSATGFATYSEGNDTTLRCMGVKKFGDREIKKQLWVHFSREDTEEEIEERKNRTGKKNKDEDSLEKYLLIMREIKADERGKSEKEIEIERLRSGKELGMIQDFYEKYYDMYTSLASQNGEANKYTVWQQGIHEISEVGKEIVKELRGGGKDDSQDEDEKGEETANFEDYKRKALPPPASQEKSNNNGADKGKPGAALLLMAKYIENNGRPLSFLETIAITFPKTYTALASVKSLEELLEKLKPFKNKLPVLGTEEAKVWLGGMLEIILNQGTSEPAENEKPAENDNPVPEKTGAEVELDIKGE